MRPPNIEVDGHRRVIRHGRLVGPAVLRWCATHLEPLWIFDDGSFACPHDLMVETTTPDHELVDGPWEVTL